ncbi:hypothetical protein [Kocuria sabuli]
MTAPSTVLHDSTGPGGAQPCTTDRLQDVLDELRPRRCLSRPPT